MHSLRILYSLFSSACIDTVLKIRDYVLGYSWLDMYLAKLVNLGHVASNIISLSQSSLDN